MSENKELGNGEVFGEKEGKPFVAPILRDDGLRALLEKPGRDANKGNSTGSRTRKRSSSPSVSKLKPQLEKSRSNVKQTEKTDTEIPRKIRARTLRLEEDQLRSNRILVGSEAEQAGLAYKILRTKAYRQFKQHGWSSVGITSPHPADGKTTTAINLAYAFARSVQNIVVLVDFDFHRPNVHNTLKFSPRYGVIDYLDGDVVISEVLYRVADTNLFVIPGRPTENSPMDLMSSNRISRFHKFLKGMFPNCYIFYDMPPVMLVDDAVIFDDKDCNLVVASESKTSVDDLHHTMELLSGQNMLGYVLNKSKHGSRISKYGYSYYGYGHSGTYTPYK